MTDTTTITGARPPTGIPAGTTYNPLAGPTSNKPLSWPIGTPVSPSTVADGTVRPGSASSLDSTFAIGLASTPGIVGDHANVQTNGVLTLTTAEWDAITGDTGGLTRGVPYYLIPAPDDGQLTTTPPSTPGDFVVRVGIALSATDFLILICCPKLVPRNGNG